MKPFERLHTFFYKWNRFTLVCTGHDLYAKPFRRNLLTYTVYGLVGIFYFSSSYTILNFDLLTVLNAFSYTCVANEVTE